MKIASASFPAEKSSISQLKAKPQGYSRDWIRGQDLFLRDFGKSQGDL